MNNGKQRKEIWLDKEVLSVLQEKAESKGWSVKQYIELLCGAQALKVKKSNLSSYASSMGEYLMKESNKKNK